MEAVRDLTEFVRLQERNPEEAFRFFKSEAFCALIPEENHRARALWRGLVLPPAYPDGMEEFLVSLGLKDIVEVDADERGGSYWSLRDPVEEIIPLTRIGRGSFRFVARTDSDFIELPRSEITDRDFLGSTCEFAFRINTGLLGRGVRRAEIRFESPCRSFTYQVTASRGSEEMGSDRAEIDRNLLQLQTLRLDYMLGRVTRADYISKSLRCIEKHYCSTTESITALRLYQAYLEKLSGHVSEASAILREFREGTREGDSENELALLYLKGLLGEDSVPSSYVQAKVRERFDRDGSSYVMLKLLFLTNPDIGRYPRRRKKAAQQVFDRGLRSPLLYAELLRDLRENGELLSSLSPLMIQTLLFAAKRGLLTQELALRTAYLSANEKFFSEPLLRVLKAAYDLWPLDGILEAIVRLLMKGQPRDASCFPWYALAVERGVKVIRLYEYYIETMPDSRTGLLPLPLRKYFLYNNTLSEEGKAVVYANFVRNRQQDPETYAACREKAEQFAYEALRDGRIGESFVLLYQEFIRVIRDEESARTLTKLLFLSRVYCEDKEAVSVSVVHDGLKRVDTAPLIRGMAYIPRYAEDAQLLFETASQARFITRAAYNVVPLCESELLLTLLRVYAVPSGGFLLHELRHLEGHACRTEEEFELYRKAAGSEEFTDSLRKKARCQTLHYIQANPDSNFFYRGMDGGELSLYAEADRAAFVRVLLKEGLYQEAYSVLLRLGTEGVPVDCLVRLTSRMIEEKNGAKDTELLEFSLKVFHMGTYDEKILAYLADHFRGEMEDMLAIRRSAASFYIDTFPLDDRILSLAVEKKMNIEDGPDILREYVRHGGRGKLIRSYLEFRSDAILGSDEPVHESVAVCIASLFDREEPMDFAMKLALLKYYSQRPKLDVHSEVQVDLLMEECARRGTRFAFMKNLPESFVRQYRLDDRVFVELKCNLDAEVLITYRLEGGPSGKEGEWKTEPLIHRFRGIFSKEFTLFYGETLRYRTKVRMDGVMEESAEKTLTAPPLSLSGNGSYQRIGRMLRAKEAGDEAALLEELCSYEKAKRASQTLFAIEETH